MEITRCAGAASLTSRPSPSVNVIPFDASVWTSVGAAVAGISVGIEGEAGVDAGPQAARKSARSKVMKSDFRNMVSPKVPPSLRGAFVATKQSHPNLEIASLVARNDGLSQNQNPQRVCWGGRRGDPSEPSSTSFTRECGELTRSGRPDSVAVS